jgi:hypothetical protein
MHDIVTAREALEFDQKLDWPPRAAKGVAGDEHEVTRQQNHETATFNRNLSFYVSNQVA